MATTYIPPYLDKWLSYTGHFVQDQYDWDHLFNNDHGRQVQEYRKMQNAVVYKFPSLHADNNRDQSGRRPNAQ